MVKQLMIYERAVPVSSERHRDWSVKLGADYGFARDVNSIPLVAAEFQASAQEYAIVFAGDDKAVFPSVILGMRDGVNNLISADGSWTGTYVPAFLRRYPFVFSSSEDKTTFTLCLDEEYAGFNKEGVGERMFDANGERTQFLETMLKFTREYQALFERTQSFCQRLKDHDLLEPGQARFNLPGGEFAALGGFFTINRDKLKALPPDVLAEMARTDELEMCYVHLQSLNNLTPLARLAASSESSEEPSISEEPSAETAENSEDA